MEDREIRLASDSPVITQQIAKRVGQERFELWFGQGVQVRLEARSLRVEVGNAFLVERMRQMFLEDLRHVAQELLGNESSVVVCVAAADLPLPQSADSLQVDSADESRQSNRRSGGGLKLRNGSPSQVTRDNSPAVVKQQPVPEANEPPAGQRRRFARLIDFEAGDSNRLAVSAVRQVIRHPGRSTPLVLFGPTGTGKTHLLEGLWGALRRHHHGSRLLYLSAEQFTSFFLEALNGQGLPSFRYKTRDVDALLIDDIQFFQGKRATLVELQHTIDALLREQKQLVLTADRAPAEMPWLGPELIARMSAGLTCQLDPLDGSTRRNLLERFAAERKLSLPAEVLDLLSSKLPGDARRLQGILNQLEAVRDASGQPLDLALARQVLGEVARVTRRVIKLPDIDQAVCEVFGLEPKSLQSSARAQSVSHPRMLAMWLARKYTRAVYAEIGEYFGQRSHSTVIAANGKVENWREQGQPMKLAYGSCEIRELIRRIEARLQCG